VTEPQELPSLIGYHPDEAEAAAQALGLRVVWVEAETPRWLSPQHEARVGRQHLRADGTLELLRVLAPLLRDEEAIEE
jgi:hypothetical protein